MAKTKSSVSMVYKKTVKEAEYLEDIAKKLDKQKNALGEEKRNLWLVVNFK